MLEERGCGVSHTRMFIFFIVAIALFSAVMWREGYERGEEVTAAKNIAATFKIMKQMDAECMSVCDRYLKDNCIDGTF